MQGQMQAATLKVVMGGARLLTGSSGDTALSIDHRGASYRRLEVKYCEGCGALGLRPAGSCQVYCRVCVQTIGGAALSQRARREA